MQIATGEREERYDVIDEGRGKAAAELSRRGGKAPTERMTLERRDEIAREAAR